MLLEKYTPFTLNAMIGNRESMGMLNKFGTDVLSGKAQKPIMIYGPSGTGKTTAARAVAYANGFEILELNSSDYRDAETITKKVVPASQTRGLFNKKILILFDEIDELSSKADAGAERVIVQLIKNSKQPIIFTANDYWDRKITFLRNYVEKAEFKRVNRADILDYLKVLAQKENKTVPAEIMEEIVKRCNGDVRAAINDLEMMFDARPELIESLSTRDRKVEIFGVLDKIFLSRSFDGARFAAMNSDVDQSMLINWVDENISNRYRSRREIGDAYGYISQASTFYERSARSNYYGYMRYSSILLSSGVAISNTGDVSMINRYNFPANIQYMSRVKKGKEAINTIANKLSPMLHANRKDIVKGSLPLIYMMVKAAEKELDKEQVSGYVGRTFGLEEKDMETISEYYKFVL